VVGGYSCLKDQYLVVTEVFHIGESDLVIMLLNNAGALINLKYLETNISERNPVLALNTQLNQYFVFYNVDDLQSEPLFHQGIVLTDGGEVLHKTTEFQNGTGPGSIAFNLLTTQYLIAYRSRSENSTLFGYLLSSNGTAVLREIRLVLNGTVTHPRLVVSPLGQYLLLVDTVNGTDFVLLDEKGDTIMWSSIGISGGLARGATASYSNSFNKFLVTYNEIGFEEKNIGLQEIFVTNLTIGTPFYFTNITQVTSLSPYLVGTDNMIAMYYDFTLRSQGFCLTATPSADGNCPKRTPRISTFPSPPVETTAPNISIGSLKFHSIFGIYLLMHFLM